MNPVFNQQPNINLLNMMSNPQAAMNNPQIQELIAKYGNPKAAFYELCKQKGIDPNTILSQIKK